MEAPGREIDQWPARPVSPFEPRAARTALTTLSSEGKGRRRRRAMRPPRRSTTVRPSTTTRNSPRRRPGIRGTLSPSSASMAAANLAARSRGFTQVGQWMISTGIGAPSAGARAETPVGTLPTAGASGTILREASRSARRRGKRRG